MMLSSTIAPALLKKWVPCGLVTASVGLCVSLPFLAASHVIAVRTELVWYARCLVGSIAGSVLALVLSESARDREGPHLSRRLILGGSAASVLLICSVWFWSDDLFFYWTLEHTL